MSSTKLAWFKSTYSGGGGGNCVEVAESPAGVLVRDSKDVARPHVRVSDGAWGIFAASVGRGDV
ncbi:DUF397 domain-containing protein [Streptomyces montanisoli]|uniref:DUF397 domain-containing protein n=1 Tax=Streptomyces montanisoli TaxID=2798581 RepID=A0A940RYM2_9ACTN|nr:DUF397 domain-containing protein [Streptomyces montanisoli]MBP0458844.1 DUF397 domain-containing protein [Streptomyces montanisoli]